MGSGLPPEPWTSPLWGVFLHHAKTIAHPRCLHACVPMWGIFAWLTGASGSQLEGGSGTHRQQSWAAVGTETTTLFVEGVVKRRQAAKHHKCAIFFFFK